MNPWISLSTAGPEFVLPDDLPYLIAFHAQLKPQRWDQKIQTHRIPEARQGPINAPVVVLQLNPSYDKVTINQPLPQDQVASSIKNIQNEYAYREGLANKNCWWSKNFKELIAEFGEAKLSQCACSIEYFPYPSKTFGHSHLRLPSQSYTFELVRSALERDALIVVTRGMQLWLGAVPALRTKLNSTVFETKNRRRPYISERNLPSGAFKKILGALRT